MTGAFISLLLIVFVITLILSVNSLMKKQCSYIFTKPPADADKIEGIIRSLIKKNSGAEITVVTLGECAEADSILERLSDDFPQLHIIKNKI